MLFYNPPPSVRKKVEESSDPSFRVLADTLNNIERYGNYYKYKKTQRQHKPTTLRRLKHLIHLIPRVDTWKRQLESVAASSDGLDVLMYHISNTYDTYHMTWRAPFVNHSRYLDHLVTAVASSLRLTPFVKYDIWHLDIALNLLFDTPTRPNPNLNETHTEIVEGIFFVLFERLSETPRLDEWLLAKKMLDYTTQSGLSAGMKSKWETAVKILTRYTEIHGDLPRGRLAWGDKGDTYLHRCVYFMNHIVLKCLLDSFEEGRRLINAVNEDGYTALTMAIKVNSIECVKTLLSFNARVEYDLWVALIRPGQQEIRELLQQAVPA
jgi:hypothetical protein